MDMEFKIRLTKNFFDAHEFFKRLESQKENTCGVYNLAVILAGLGFNVRIDELAEIARMNVHIDEHRRFMEAKEIIKTGSLPEKAVKRLYHEYWYECNYRVTHNYSESGISPEGVIRSCEAVTGGKYTCVPIPSRKGEEIYFTSQAFDKLIDYILGRGFNAILNYRTSKLLDPNGKFYDLDRILEFHRYPEFFEKWAWDVGHFVSLAGALEFEDGDRWLIIRDTYKNFGYGGYHLQPQELVREALVRDDGREGGILLVVNSKLKDQIIKELNGIGIRTGLWDNGSPF